MRIHRRCEMSCLGALCLLLIAFGGRSARASDLEKAAEKGRVVAEVNGEKITAEELDRSMAILLYSVEQQLFKVRGQKLEELIAERLISRKAAEQKISMEELIEKEVTSKVEKVTDEEVEAVYQLNKGRLTGDEGEIKRQVRTYLQERKAQAAKERFLASLKGQARISVSLEEPEPPVTAELPLEGAPARGPERAPVTLVEFVDYQ